MPVTPFHRQVNAATPAEQAQLNQQLADAEAVFWSMAHTLPLPVPPPPADLAPAERLAVLMRFASEALSREQGEGAATAFVKRWQQSVQNRVVGGPADDPSCTIHFVYEPGFDDEIDFAFQRDIYEVLDEAEALFKSNGITLSRDEKVYEVCLSADERVVAASSVVELPQDGGMPVVRFSLVVHPDYRRNHHARTLARRIVAAFPEYTIEGWVVNPHMLPMLEEMGFESTEREWSENTPFLELAPRTDVSGAQEEYEGLLHSLQTPPARLLPLHEPREYLLPPQSGGTDASLLAQVQDRSGWLIGAARRILQALSPQMQARFAVVALEVLEPYVSRLLPTRYAIWQKVIQSADRMFGEGPSPGEDLRSLAEQVVLAADSERRVESAFLFTVVSDLSQVVYLTGKLAASLKDGPSQDVLDSASKIVSGSALVAGMILTNSGLMIAHDLAWDTFLPRWIARASQRHAIKDAATAIVSGVDEYDSTRKRLDSAPTRTYDPAIPHCEVPAAILKEFPPPATSNWNDLMKALRSLRPDIRDWIVLFSAEEVLPVWEEWVWGPREGEEEAEQQIRSSVTDPHVARRCIEATRRYLEGTGALEAARDAALAANKVAKAVVDVPRASAALTAVVCSFPTRTPARAALAVRYAADSLGVSEDDPARHEWLRKWWERMLCRVAFQASGNVSGPPSEYEKLRVRLEGQPSVFVPDAAPCKVPAKILAAYPAPTEDSFASVCAALDRVPQPFHDWMIFYAAKRALPAWEAWSRTADARQEMRREPANWASTPRLFLALIRSYMEGRAAKEEVVRAYKLVEGLSATASAARHSDYSSYEQQQSAQAAEFALESMLRVAELNVRLPGPLGGRSVDYKVRVDAVRLAVAAREDAGLGSAATNLQQWWHDVLCRLPFRASGEVSGVSEYETIHEALQLPPSRVLKQELLPSTERIVPYEDIVRIALPLIEQDATPETIAAESGLSLEKAADLKRIHSYSTHRQQDQIPEFLVFYLEHEAPSPIAKMTKEAAVHVLGRTLDWWIEEIDRGAVTNASTTEDRQLLSDLADEIRQGPNFEGIGSNDRALILDWDFSSLADDDVVMQAAYGLRAAIETNFSPLFVVDAVRGLLDVFFRNENAHERWEKLLHERWLPIRGAQSGDVVSGPQPEQLASPAKLTRDELESWLDRTGARNWQGPLDYEDIKEIAASSDTGLWVLRLIPLSEIGTWQAEPQPVNRMPIVFAYGEVLDGKHRVGAANARGESAIWAYVPSDDEVAGQTTGGAAIEGSGRYDEERPTMLSRRRPMPEHDRTLPGSRMKTQQATRQPRKSVRTAPGPTHQSMMQGDERAVPTALLPKQKKPAMHVGRYRIVKVLGQGGMGAVYLAEDPSAGDRTVAVKVIKGQVEGTKRARFLLEGRVTANLEHPNIIPIYDVGSDPKHGDFYVMRLLPGRDMSAYLKEQPPLRDMLTVFLKVLDGMAYAHEQGVIHRDLKPDNVFIGPHGQVAVADWGIAKVLASKNDDLYRDDLSVMDLDDLHEEEESDDLTMEGVIMGTPAYMPPEQARGEIGKLDPRSDIYSLGGILYTILTGLKPIEGKGLRPLLKKIRAGRVTAPRARLRHEGMDPSVVPAELESVVMKAMAKEPARRYQSAEEMKADIEAYLEHRPMVAHRDAPMAAVKKYVQRKPAAALGIAGGSLFSMAVAAIGAFAMAGVQSAQAEKDLAEQKAQVAQLEAGQRAAEAEQARVRAALAAGEVEELQQELGISVKFERDRALDDVRSRVREAVEQGRQDNIMADMPNAQVERYMAAFRQALDAEERLGTSFTDYLDWISLGKIYESALGAPDRALAAYEEAERRNPAYREIVAHKANALYAMESWSELEQLTRQSLSNNHQLSAEVRILLLGHLGNALNKVGDHTGALEAFRDSLSLMERDHPYRPAVEDAVRRLEDYLNR